MSSDSTYPVLCEINLPAVPSKMFGRVRRDLDELPTSPPGTALVFQVDGQFHVYDERRRLTGNEPFVTEALAVAVVNLRPHRFSTELTAHSRNPSEDFTIQVIAEAVVDRPELVTRAGALDLAQSLADHLRQDREVGRICAGRAIEEIASVRKMVDARMTSYYKHRPLYQPGIQISLQLVEVRTPSGVAERDRATLHTRQSHSAQMLENALSHERRIQSTGFDQDHDFHTSEWERTQRFRADVLEQEHWSRMDKIQRDMDRRAQELEWRYKTQVEQLEEEQRKQMLDLQHQTRMREIELTAKQRELERSNTDAAADHMKKYYDQGVAGLLALAAAEGLITPLEMAELLRDDESKSLDYIKNLISSLIGEGRGDLVSVDLQSMVDTLQTKLLGRLVDRSGRMVAGGRESAAGEITSNDVDGGHDENPPDEDEFQ